jgi:hypothetical protein
MLYKNTVETKTFELLVRLSNDPVFSHFLLAGGTNLALRIGHRKSIDIDFFNFQEFETEDLVKHLTLNYNFESAVIRPRGTIKGTIENVKIDIISHPYKLLEPPITIENIRFYGLNDIIAMKLNAISDNGSRLKDFVDIAFLSTRFSLKEMVECYTAKYQAADTRAYRGIAYFDDINFNVSIDLIGHRKFDWEKIEKRIVDMIKYETKVFSTEPI